MNESWASKLSRFRENPQIWWQEFVYWNIKRRSQRFIPWVARKLPERVKFYVVIHGIAKIEPNFSPEKVTGMQMLDLWDPSKKELKRLT